MPPLNLFIERPAAQPDPDWNHTRPPSQPGLRLRLWMRSGEVRTAAMRADARYIGLAFTDCTHPLQNVAVDQRDVMAWKVED